ncbi:unnamed protein product [Malus baccata var. baccata]
MDAKNMKLYSEFQSSKRDEYHLLSVNKLLDLEDDKNATSWIKVALAANHTPSFALSMESSVEATNHSHKPSQTHGDRKPKGKCIMKIKHKNEAGFGCAIEKENSSQGWVKGNGFICSCRPGKVIAW